MGQTVFWLKIGPIEVPRPPSGSDFHENHTRNLIFGVPGPLGANLGNFELGGGGPMYAIVLRLTGAGLGLAGNDYYIRWAGDG